MQDTSSAHKVLGASTIEKMSKQKNIVTSCTIRELKSLFRTPAYYVSSLIISLGCITCSLDSDDCAGCDDVICLRDYP